MSASAGPNKRSHEDLGADDEASRGPAKKPRQEGDGGAGELQRDEEFWEEDGTVILVARTAVSFRVYKGVLAHHSPVFADMFSLPQPLEDSTVGGPNDPGCPLVHLDDHPEDLRHILRAILPRKDATVIHREPHRPTFSVISAYARLGHKYQIEHLLTQSVEFLKDFYPASDQFDKWLARSAYVPPSWQPYHAIGVVNLARLVDCPSILPTALAVCCTLEPRVLLHGFKPKGGVRETLREPDLLRCIRGKDVLRQEGAAAVLRAFAPFANAECVYAVPADICLNGVREMLHDLADVAHEHPFCPWSFYTAQWKYSLPVCESCEEMVAERLHTEQMRIWKRLPSLLALQVKGWK